MKSVRSLGAWSAGKPDRQKPDYPPALSDFEWEKERQMLKSETRQANWRRANMTKYTAHFAVRQQFADIFHDDTQIATTFRAA